VNAVASLLLGGSLLLLGVAFGLPQLVRAARRRVLRARAA